jgi:hypothetical protein
MTEEGSDPVIHGAATPAANHIDVPSIEPELVTQRFAVSIAIGRGLAPCDGGSEGKDTQIEIAGTRRQWHRRVLLVTLEVGKGRGGVTQYQEKTGYPPPAE